MKELSDEQLVTSFGILSAALANRMVANLARSNAAAGDELEVEFLRFLRPEMKFSGVEELRAQIGRDRTAACADFSLR